MIEGRKERKTEKKDKQNGRATHLHRERERKI
jgi:hypothetical protein